MQLHCIRLAVQLLANHAQVRRTLTHLLARIRDNIDLDQNPE
jgi:hypothetical protein